MFHLSADDIVIILVASIENKFSENIKKLEQRVSNTLKKLENFADDLLLLVNVANIKAMLVHNVVPPRYPQMYYKTQQIEHVKKFRYLGMTISDKLGRDYYIKELLETVRKVHKLCNLVTCT